MAPEATNPDAQASTTDDFQFAPFSIELFSRFMDDFTGQKETDRKDAEQRLGKVEELKQLSASLREFVNSENPSLLEIPVRVRTLFRKLFIRCKNDLNDKFNIRDADKEHPYPYAPDEKNEWSIYFNYVVDRLNNVERVFKTLEIPQTQHTEDTPLLTKAEVSVGFKEYALKSDRFPYELLIAANDFLLAVDKLLAAAEQVYFIRTQTGHKTLLTMGERISMPEAVTNPLDSQRETFKQNLREQTVKQVIEMRRRIVTDLQMKLDKLKKEESDEKQEVKRLEQQIAVEERRIKLLENVIGSYVVGTVTEKLENKTRASGTEDPDNTLIDFFAQDLPQIERDFSRATESTDTPMRGILKEAKNDFLIKFEREKTEISVLNREKIPMAIESSRARILLLAAAATDVQGRVELYREIMIYNTLKASLKELEEQGTKKERETKAKQRLEEREAKAKKELEDNKQQIESVKKRLKKLEGQAKKSKRGKAKKEEEPKSLEEQEAEKKEEKAQIQKELAALEKVGSRIIKELEGLKELKEAKADKKENGRDIELEKPLYLRIQNEHAYERGFAKVAKEDPALFGEIQQIFNSSTRLLGAEEVPGQEDTEYDIPLSEVLRKAFDHQGSLDDLRYTPELKAEMQNAFDETGYRLAQIQHLQDPDQPLITNMQTARKAYEDLRAKFCLAKGTEDERIKKATEAEVAAFKAEFEKDLDERKKEAIQKRIQEQVSAVATQNEEQIKQLRQDLAEARAELRKARTEARKPGGAMDTKKQIDAAVKKAQDKADAIKKELEEKLQQAETDLKNTQEKLAALETDPEGLLEAARRDLILAQEESRSNSEANQNLRRRLDDAQAVNGDLAARIQALQSAITNLPAALPQVIKVLEGKLAELDPKQQPKQGGFLSRVTKSTPAINPITPEQAAKETGEITGLLTSLRFALTAIEGASQEEPERHTAAVPVPPTAPGSGSTS